MHKIAGVGRSDSVAAEKSPAHTTKKVPVRKLDADVLRSGDDSVAIEEPLEIRLAWPVASPSGQGDDMESRNVAVTMRTPGNDAELALGFLFTEGIVRSAEQVAAVGTSSAMAMGDDANRVTVQLRGEPDIDLSVLDRNFYVTSSCGVCGKTAIEAIRTEAQFAVGPDELRVAVSVLTALPQQLERQQRVFSDTGSIHAAALFGSEGLVGQVYEDVGRHNAVDKLLGANFLRGALPLRNTGILVSGRVSFELVQKARMAGCAMLAAVGAPSSLAIDLAWDSDMTLIGFLRDGRFNIYTGPARIAGALSHLDM
jgi:FdhD protein